MRINLNLPPNIAAAYSGLGFLDAVAMRDLSYFWYTQGIESSPLLQLGAESNPSLTEHSKLFEQGLAEIGVPIPTKAKAALTVAKHIASETLDGLYSPLEGARELWENLEAVSPVGIKILRDLTGSISEIIDLPERTARDGDDRTKYKQELEGQILEAMRQVIKIPTDADF